MILRDRRLRDRLEPPADQVRGLWLVALRDQSGTVIIIPFSDVLTVQNRTKNFSFVVFDIGIACRENLDQVITVVTAIADELEDDIKYTTKLIESI